MAAVSQYNTFVTRNRNFRERRFLIGMVGTWEVLTSLPGGSYSGSVAEIRLDADLNHSAVRVLAKRTCCRKDESIVAEYDQV